MPVKSVRKQAGDAGRVSLDGSADLYYDKTADVLKVINNAGHPITVLSTGIGAGGALGSLLFRDTGASDGASWLAAGAGVLACAGAGQAPAWSANLTMTGPAIFSGPNHAFGVDETRDYVGVRMTNHVTSGGAGQFVTGLDVDPTIIAHAGDTAWQAYFDVVGYGITTQPSDTISWVASAYLQEPRITKGAGATILEAATLYIRDNPTEGTRNASVIARGTTAPQLYIYGYDSIVPANNDGGELVIGAFPAFQGMVSYTGSTNELVLSNTLDTVGGNIVMRVRGAGSPLRALVVTGEGNVQMLNSRYLFGNNSADVPKYLIGVNGLNKVDIDANALGVSMGGSLACGAITSNGGLHTFGANDSAGAGYRLVKVPNV